jgi:hypothetical protein
MGTFSFILNLSRFMAVALFTKHNFCNDTMVSNKNPTKYLVFEGIKNAYWYAKDILSFPSKRVVHKNNL